MGFREVRARVIEALRSERVRHEQRAGGGENNLLEAEQVTGEFVIHLLLRCSGYRYETSSHHWIPDVACHVFTPKLGGERWYIKVYLPGENAVFISVHPP